MEKNQEFTINDASYKELNNFFDKKGGFLEDQDKKYSAALDEYEPQREYTEGKIFAKYGLKFHVSLHENDEENLNKGCNIVKSILMDNHVTTFKVIRQGRKMSEDPD